MRLSSSSSCEQSPGRNSPKVGLSNLSNRVTQIDHKSPPPFFPKSFCHLPHGPKICWCHRFAGLDFHPDHAFFGLKKNIQLQAGARAIEVYLFLSLNRFHPFDHLAHYHRLIDLAGQVSTKAAQRAHDSNIEPIQFRCFDNGACYVAMIRRKQDCLVGKPEVLQISLGRVDAILDISVDFRSSS